MRDILRLLQEFLLSHNLAASARALELESGCRVPESNEDVAFCRELVLDGRWAETEDLLAPLARACWLRERDRARACAHARAHSRALSRAT